MNSDKHVIQKQCGNAMIYILIALVLLAALTMLITRLDDSASGQDLSSEQAELMTTKAVAFAGSAKNVVDQMLMSGTNINNLSFVTPNQSSYDTAPHINKVFHPDGGGFNLGIVDSNVFTGATTAPVPGWYMGRFNNVDWTPTSANDVLFVAHGISQTVCANLNKKITGATTIPALTGIANAAALFVDYSVSGVANLDFTAAQCASCEGYPSLCVSNAGGTEWTYYNIIEGL